MTNPVSPEIARWCRVLRVAVALFALGALGLHVSVWLWPQVSFGTNPAEFIVHSMQATPSAINSLPLENRLMLAAAGLPYLIALGYALYRLDALLRGFARGEFFEIATVRSLRAFSGYLLLAKILSMLIMHVRGYLLDQYLGPQIMHRGISLSNDGIALLLMCALFFLLARMMEEGRRLAEENRGFV